MEYTPQDLGPLVNKGEDFIYQGKAWRTDSEPWDAGGSAGRFVMAKRLEWNDGVHAYGEAEAIRCSGLAAVDFEDESVFLPHDPDGKTFGLFDRANKEATT